MERAIVKICKKLFPQHEKSPEYIFHILKCLQGNFATSEISPEILSWGLSSTLPVNIVTYNVNGFAGRMRNGLAKEFSVNGFPSILCMQETKCSSAVVEKELHSVYPFIYVNDAQKKGYSGTAMCSKFPISRIFFGLLEDEKMLVEEKNTEHPSAVRALPHNEEGRIITAEVLTPRGKVWIVTVYTPNSGAELDRLRWRVEVWDVLFRQHMKILTDNFQNIILCGDLNVAHLDADVHSPKTMLDRVAGFTVPERKNFNLLLAETGLVDPMPPKANGLTRWSYYRYFMDGWKRQKGWRLDYFLTRDIVVQDIKTLTIFRKNRISDHCPLQLTI